MIAVVTEYTLDADAGLRICRTGEGDRWAVRTWSSRLSREAIAWRVANPGARLAPPTRCPGWGYEPMPSSRDDDYVRDHTYTLAEALAVCESTPVPAATDRLRAAALAVSVTRAAVKAAPDAAALDTAVNAHVDALRAFDAELGR